MNTTGIPLKDPAVSAAAGDTEQFGARVYRRVNARASADVLYIGDRVADRGHRFLAMVVSSSCTHRILLSGISFLTWGRLRPAHMNVMVYGWASMAGMGTAVWLMARLCRATLRFPLLIAAGAAFWNLGVLIGVGAILLGDSTGFQWLDFRVTWPSFCRRADAEHQHRPGSHERVSDEQNDGHVTRKL